MTAAPWSCDLGPARLGHALVSYVGAEGTARIVGWLPERKLHKSDPEALTVDGLKVVVWSPPPR